MGGCATKPKVLKSDEAEVPEPVPAPESVSKEVTVVENVVGGGDEKKVKEGDGVGAGVVGGGHDHEAVAAGKVKEIVVEDDKVAAPAAAAADDGTAVAAAADAGSDQESKPRSLSNLFKSEEENDWTAGDQEATSKAPMVTEETKEIEKPKEESKKPIEVSEVVKQPESEKLEALAEPMSPTFVDAPDEKAIAVAEKAPEVAAAAAAAPAPVETLEVKETPEIFKPAVETLEVKETPEKIIKTEEVAK